MRRVSLRFGVPLVSALGVLAGFAAPARSAEGQADLKQKALALNFVTGQKPIEGHIKALVADPAGTRRLLAVAKDLASQKDQPLSYTGAYILARAAEQLKDPDAGAVFYHVCVRQALKLRSERELTKAYNALLSLLVKNKKEKELTQLCQEVLEIRGSTEDLRKLQNTVLPILLRSLVKHGEAEKALKVADSLIKADPDGYGPRLLKADLLHEAGKNKDAAKEYEDLLERADRDKSLDKPKRNSLRQTVRFDLARVYADTDQLDKAAQQLEALLGQRKGNNAAQLWIQLLAANDQVAKAVALADRLIKARPQDYRAYELKAVALRQAGRDEEAAKQYEDLLSRIAKDPAVADEEKPTLTQTCRYILSNTYMELNRPQKAIDELRVLVREKPDNATFNNDLGYIMADNGQDLDEAERLIRKALEEDRKAREKRRKELTELGENPGPDRDNSAYLDSLGWVLFKKKKLEEARTYLQKALEDEEGQHAEIYDHLGDVQSAMGNKADAVKAWKKAVELANEGKRDQARKKIIEKKIKDAR